MGGFASALGAVGNRMHEERLINWQANYAANQHMADVLEQMAKDPTIRPELRDKVYEAAFYHRTLSPEKTAKGFDLHTILTNYAKSVLGGQPQPKQQEEWQRQQPNPNTIPEAHQASKGSAAGAGVPSEGQQPTNAPLPTATVAGTPNPAALPAPPAVEQAQQASEVIRQQQAAASAPPAVSGMPSPGFSTPGSPQAQQQTPGFNLRPQQSLPQPPTSLWLSPEEQMQRLAAFEGAKVRAAKGAERATTQEYGQEDIAIAKQLGIDLTPQQQAEMLTGKRLGKTYIPIPGVGMFDQTDGTIIEAAKPMVVPFGGSLVNPNTKEVIHQGQAPVGGADIVPYPTQSGYAKLLRDKGGNVMGYAMTPEGKVAAVLPGSGYLRRVSEHIIGVDDGHGNIVMQAVPLTSMPILPGGGGQQQPVTGRPGGPPVFPKGGAAQKPFPTPPAAAATTSAIPSPAGRRLGMSPQQTIKQWENPLTPEAEKTVAEMKPTLAMIDRAIAMLEPVKHENMPFAHSLQRLGYKFGLATDASQLINQLELIKVMGAARVLKGSSRAYPALEVAMQHLPNAARGSNMLMYEQLQSVRQNLMDVINTSELIGQKYPGLPRPPGAGAGAKTGTAPTPNPEGEGPKNIVRWTRDAQGNPVPVK